MNYRHDYKYVLKVSVLRFCIIYSIYFIYYNICILYHINVHIEAINMYKSIDFIEYFTMLEYNLLAEVNIGMESCNDFNFIDSFLIWFLI